MMLLSTECFYPTFKDVQQFLRIFQTPFDEFSIALAIFSVTLASIHAAITIKTIEIRAKVKYS
ncbi:hypothetical protein [Ferroglobus sp.]|uniref:hypothetical protein n=1 Tax=Ferroglobus sp. TaxID=2614230 RepID=UPI0025C737C5|nr:hypothetical protein [Ferroglobus sp.]